MFGAVAQLAPKLKEFLVSLNGGGRVVFVADRAAVAGPWPWLPNGPALAARRPKGPTCGPGDHVRAAVNLLLS